MKNKICGLIFAIFIMITLLSACNSSNSVTSSYTDNTTVETKAESIVEATIEKPTEKATETPTQAPATLTPETEQSVHEYTGLELADMNMKDVIAIMDGDYDTVSDIVSPAFSSVPIDYYYNDDVLPGFFFTDCRGESGDFNTNEFAIAMKNGAKLNDTISSDMTYNELASVIGDFDVQAIGGAWSLCYSTTIEGRRITFIVEPNDYLYQNAVEGQLIPSDMLREANPNLQSIALRTNN